MRPKLGLAVANPPVPHAFRDIGEERYGWGQTSIKLRLTKNVFSQYNLAMASAELAMDGHARTDAGSESSA
jgi:hypothetical protein